MNVETKYYGELVQENELKQRLYRETARCYSSVFVDQPWQEAFKDGQGNFYPIDRWPTWRQDDLQRAYPLVETSDYIQRETSKSDSVFVWRGLAENPRKIIGFSWGYSIDSVIELVESKWSGTEAEEQQQLETLFEEKLSNPKIWYFSEIGVLAKYRQRGMAMEMSQEMISQAPRDRDVLVRTNASSPLTVILKKLAFEQILGPETIIEDGQLVGDVDSVVAQLDPVNPERVVYVLPAEKRQS